MWSHDVPAWLGYVEPFSTLAAVLVAGVVYGHQLADARSRRRAVDARVQTHAFFAFRTIVSWFADPRRKTAATSREFVAVMRPHFGAVEQDLRRMADDLPGASRAIATAGWRALALFSRATLLIEAEAVKPGGSEPTLADAVRDIDACGDALGKIVDPELRGLWLQGARGEVEPT